MSGKMLQSFGIHQIDIDSILKGCQTKMDQDKQ